MVVTLKRRLAATSLLALALFAAGAQAAAANFSITVYSEKLKTLIDPAAPVKVVAEGMQWSEGPVWIEAGADSYLLFSDVPRNKIMRWNPQDGLTVFLEPSGFEGKDASAFREAGTNGLVYFGNNTLLAANHGQRQLTMINLQTRKKTPLITLYKGKRFSSPNDVVVSGNRDVYFTDPPFGLTGINDSPLKEQPFNGVYRLSKEGLVSLIDDSLAFPNGIGLFPGAHDLLVSNTDAKNPVWIKYTLDFSGKVLATKMFYNASAQVAQGLKGLPDGLKIDQNGNVFATGPGGVYILSPTGELLGMINLDSNASNVGFGGPSGSTLFITNGSRVLQVETLTRALANP